MADISQEIAKIGHAIYGEEVRSAIIDSLTAMNEQASKAQEWATGEDDPTESPSATNNAEYWAGQAAASAATGESALANEADEFDTTKAYAIGDIVVYSKVLYRFTAAHAAGAWSASDVEEITISDILAEKLTVDDIDDNFDMSGKAADAKATGDRIGKTENGLAFATADGYVSLDLTQKTTTTRVISNGKKWTARSNEQTACVYNVPPGIGAIKITGVANGCFAFLKSIDNMNTTETPDFCDNYTERIEVVDTTPVEYAVSGCNYIWAYLTNSVGSDIALTSIQCDSKIVSEGELSGAIAKVNERFLEETTLDDDDLVTGFIQNTGKWATGGSSKGWMHEIAAETLCRITANASYNAIIAFLIDDTVTNGVVADFSTYSRSRIVITANTAGTYTIPPDAKYLFIGYKSSANNDVSPEKVEFDTAEIGDATTDKTLTVEDKAADAKETGDRLAALENRLTIAPIDTSTLGYAWKQGRINPNSGEWGSSNYYCMEEAYINATLLPDRFVYCGPRIYTKNSASTSVTLIINEYKGTPNNETYIRRHILDELNNVYERSPDCLYIRFSIGSTGSAMAFAPADAAACFAIGTTPEGDIFDVLFSGADWKTAMMLARARQVTSVRFDPLANMPNQAGDYTPGTIYTGVPYSSPRALDTYVGINVSMDTFCTALKNPKSVLYTRQSIINNSKTYYGMVCSSLADFMMGLAAPVNTFTMGDSADFEKRDFYAMKPGYVFVNSTHAYLIYNIRRDKYGRPTSFGIVEAAPPRVYYNAYSLDSLRAHLNSHPGGPFHLYEFVGDADLDYRPCKYVAGYPDEIVETTYPDIMTEYGDLAVVPAGTDVTINVIDSTGYTGIKVYRSRASKAPDALKAEDYELIEDNLSVEDFTMEDVGWGVWKIVMVGSGVSSETKFIAVDMTCSLVGTTAKFESNNATPIYVNAYDDMTQSYTKADMRNFHKLTADEVTAGASNSGFDVSDILTQDYPYLRIEFQTDWGQAVWRSHPFDPVPWTGYPEE